MDLAKCNATESSHCKWVTLTYADAMIDHKRVYEDGKMFLRRFQKYLDNNEEIFDSQKSFKRITVAEPQGETHDNSWHLHVIFIFDAPAPFIDNEVIAELWGYGITDTHKVYDAEGFENAYGYGRPLAVWLIDRKCIVKDVNTAISNRQVKHRGAMYRKSDTDDAQAIALATINMLDILPDACPNDVYWSLGQLVHRRDNIMRQRTRLMNQLYEQLCIAYPSYKTFFTDIGRATALYFWSQYPSQKYLKEKTVEESRDQVNNVIKF